MKGKCLKDWQVRGILDGRVSLLVDIAKDVPHFEHAGRDIMDWPLSGIREEGGKFYLAVQTDVDDYRETELNPPFPPGSRVFVKEAWRCLDFDAGYDNGMQETGDCDCEPAAAAIEYKADNKTSVFDEIYPEDGDAVKAAQKIGIWHPLILMPQWASRIELEVVSVGVKRVQSVTEEEARAYGMIGASENPFCIGDCRTAYSKLHELWETQHPGSWQRNEWVWLVGVRRVR